MLFSRILYLTAFLYRHGKLKYHFNTKLSKIIMILRVLTYAKSVFAKFFRVYQFLIT